MDARNSPGNGAAIIGYGAITHEIVECLDRIGETGRIVGILDLPERLEELNGDAAGRFPVVGRLDELLALGPPIVVECAGHGTVHGCAGHVLAPGTDFLMASVGTLAEAEFAQALVRAAAPGTRLLISAGAIAGVDGLLAAPTAGLRAVTYSSLPPPKAWVGTPAEDILDLAATEQARTFFKGTVRQAALDYPQNANVGATVALAGMGLDATRVKLVADPGITDSFGTIEAEGNFGTFRFEIFTHAAPSNPKTSLLTAHSIVHAMRHGGEPFAFDVLKAL
ncbi:MAG: aspartate dehydrogenase [Rhodospirillales bacterium]|jgi:aspartate dehydrogenase|nr:aspartate dehydrogenase [Rhodospirillales bacterium]